MGVFLIMPWVIIAALGAVVGSAANALIDRLPKKISWARGRSRCDSCGHQLNASDLIPVVSFLCLGGKCRYCHRKIASRNLIVELAMVVGVSGIIGLRGITGESMVLVGIWWLTVIIAVMDWETRLVHEGLVLVWGLLGVVSSGYGMSSLWGALVGLGLVGGLWAVTRGRAMGFGDVEIATVMGMWLGWPKIGVALWVAFVVGGIVGGWLLVGGKKKLKSEIAFGPYLILGAWVAFMWGDMIKLV